MTRPRLLVATANRGKVAEYEALLEGLDCELVSLADVGVVGDVEETGTTYEENARIKAWAGAARSGLVTLADDSGLEVDALYGAPGIYSARYAGDDASDADRVAYLLENMKGVPWPQRTARFVCVIALALPDGEVTLCRGECAGFIVEEPRGTEGFGYDPAFFVPELNRTVSELPAEVKNRISHRGKAAVEARKVLRNFIDEGRCQ
ncbi:MAG: XTP/dITP diphosphatase [Dehalococcoidia bacterium]|nr:XTP/dITP diphosphatase [Dehalococcoidia bacterium]